MDILHRSEDTGKSPARTDGTTWQSGTLPRPETQGDRDSNLAIGVHQGTFHRDLLGPLPHRPTVPCVWTARRKADYCGTWAATESMLFAFQQFYHRAARSMQEM